MRLPPQLSPVPPRRAPERGALQARSMQMYVQNGGVHHEDPSSRELGHACEPTSQRAGVHDVCGYVSIQIHTGTGSEKRAGLDSEAQCAVAPARGDEIAATEEDRRLVAQGRCHASQHPAHASPEPPISREAWTTRARPSLGRRLLVARGIRFTGRKRGESRRPNGSRALKTVVCHAISTPNDPSDAARVSPTIRGRGSHRPSRTREIRAPGTPHDPEICRSPRVLDANR